MENTNNFVKSDEHLLKYDFTGMRFFQTIFDKAVELAKGDKIEAKNFFDQYCEWILQDAPDINTIEEAKTRAKSNFGYHAGRYDKETMELVYSTYDCEHPYLGRKPWELTPQEIFSLCCKLY